ncbi:MAG: hypothetical protein E7408_00765 [Ruminococcaceae bacterium]|nr:hypothetical protein [Oscillospiraceae bacterium]
MHYLIGLDIGTSSVKGVLLSETGKIKKTAHEAFVYTKTKDGGVEISAKDYLAACLAAIRSLANGADGEIRGVCASAATGNTLLLDENGEPLTPILNWQDTRVTTEADAVFGEMDKDAFYRQIGWPFNGKTFPLAHLSFWKTHMPQIYKKAKYVCMSTEYLYKYLTGNFGISRSAGTPFFLMDQKSGKYIPSLLDKLEITEGMLPEIGKCGQIVGTVRKECAAECGLFAGTPLMLGSFDHPSAARGVGVLKEGQLLLSCGTSWVGFFPVSDREKAEKAGMLLDPFLSETGGPWGAMTSVASVSANIKQYIDRYIDKADKAFATLSELAAKAAPGAGGLRLCPLDKPDDKKVQGFEKTDIARAIMEGTVALLKARLDFLKEKGISASEAIMVGGPSEDPMWRKIIEEMCGFPVRTVHGAHAGAVGAALMAGIGAGIFKDEEAAASVAVKGE